MQHLLQEIEDAFKAKDYDKTIEKIDEYMNIPGVGMYANLFHMYIVSHIRKGLYATAANYIDLMQQMFPNHFDKKKLVVFYATCKQRFDVQDLLKENSFTREEYFDIAKECFYNEMVDIAKNLFTKIIDSSKEDYLNEKAREYLERIKDYESIQSSVGLGYYSFKKSDMELVPGHIVYISNLSNDYIENKDNEDPKKYVRPYMIWKIFGERIYAFPLIKARESDKYVLFHQNYPGSSFDRTIKDRLVVFEEESITKVMGKVYEKDYNILLNKLYIQLCFQNSFDEPRVAKFMSEHQKQMNIQKYDIIYYVDSNNRKKKIYFVLEIDEDNDCYDLIELESVNSYTYNVVGKKIERLKKGTTILYKLSISQTKKDSIISQIPEIMESKILGSIVNYNNMLLEVMIEKEEYYIAADRNNIKNNSFFMHVEFIPKHANVSVVQSLSSEEYASDLDAFKKYLEHHKFFLKQKEREYNRKCVK